MQTPYILIIDDDIDDHYLISKALKEIFMSPKILSVFDGRQAIEYLQQSKAANIIPDLIFMDLRVGGLTNEEYVKMIKQDEWLKRIPLIVFSGIPAAENVSLLKDMGIDEFYKKPSSYPEVFGIVQEVCHEFIRTKSSG